MSRRTTLPKRSDTRDEQPERIPLPAVKPTGGALALPDITQLESELETVTDLMISEDDPIGLMNGAEPSKEIERVRRALRPRWEAVNRRASANRIATQLGLLAAAFPNTARTELDVFVKLLAADVAALKPTLYELAVAARAVRSKCEFLSIAAVVKEIKAAKRQTEKSHFVATGSFYRDYQCEGIASHNYWLMLDVLSRGQSEKPERGPDYDPDYDDDDV
jgi:hypothetical protein